jgi:hypothetical protein
MYRLIYPSNHPTKALPREHFLKRHGGVIIKPPLPPLQRNPLIVKAATYLIACPAQANHIIRSGTWTTYRLGVKMLGQLNVEVLVP